MPQLLLWFTYEILAFYQNLVRNLYLASYTSSTSTVIIILNVVLVLVLEVLKYNLNYTLIVLF